MAEAGSVSRRKAVRRSVASAFSSPARSTATSEWKRYATFLRTPAEFVVAWVDAPTGARAWLVINSSRGGAAGGGTRMRAGLSVREVTYLAKAMELKFALSEPPIGGAKTGIDFDPDDARKQDVLERWYRTVAPLLRDRYGTGGDLNVDEALDVLPAFARLGLEHPQEGVIRGHVRPNDDEYRAIMERMEAGVVAPLDGGLGVVGLELSVADTITGYGLAAAVRRYYERSGRPFEGARVLLEGFGNVGASCALHLARSGARIVSIRDAFSTFHDPVGLDASGVEDLFRRRRNKMLPAEDARTRASGDGAVFWQPADVFVCAAISQSVTRETLDRLEACGVRMIAAGANQPFREAKIGSTRVAQHADRRFTVLADILSNMGMARVFSYLMQKDARPAARSIFDAVERTIVETVDEVIERTRGADRALLAATLGLALDRITGG
ncbi:MAG: Glu/Leu/Phe/Val dehydrogenase dimerization domain-containing protein [Longimicrobiales bacterium]